MRSFPKRAVGALSPATNFVSPAVGATGATGPAGTVGGAISIKYTFSNTTTDADPGSGFVRLNSATQNAATKAYLSVDDLGGASWAAALDDGNSSVKGFMRLTSVADANKWVLFSVSSLITASGYRKLTITNVASSQANPFSNGDNVVLTIDLAGDIDTEGYPFVFSDTTTDSDPGSGVIRLNNATQVSSTVMRVDDFDVYGTVFSDIIDGVFSLAPTTTKAVIKLVALRDTKRWMLFTMTGVSPQTGYTNLTVVEQAASATNPFLTGEPIRLSFDIVGSPIATGDLTCSATNDDAAAGDLGEYITSNIAIGSGAALTTGNASNITSLSLTAGDWEVWGHVLFGTAATTSINLELVGISQTSATQPSIELRTCQSHAAFVPGATNVLTATPPRQRLSLSGTTTIYLVARANFTVSTCTAYGFLSARRPR